MKGYKTTGLGLIVQTIICMATVSYIDNSLIVSCLENKAVVGSLENESVNQPKKL